MRASEKHDLQDDLDALFKLPLDAGVHRRAQPRCAQLKKSGRGDEAAHVKALAKPSISAWAVNQLFWHHRKAFDQLIALGERFHRAQSSGKIADMRASLDARREVLSQLTEIAASILRGCRSQPLTRHSPPHHHDYFGRNVSLRIAGRWSTTGRLTQDVDPPGLNHSARSFRA
jgi:hypothetical protein